MWALHSQPPLPDVVRAILAVLRTGEPTFGEVYHICGKGRLTLPELLDIMAKHSNRCAKQSSRCIVLSEEQASLLTQEERELLASFSPFDGADRAGSMRTPRPCRAQRGAAQPAEGQASATHRSVHPTPAGRCPQLQPYQPYHVASQQPGEPTTAVATYT